MRQTWYSRDELLRMTIADLDPEYPSSSPEVFRARAVQGLRIVFETMHLTRSGSLLPVEVSLTATLYEGKIYNSAFVRDLSDRDRNVLGRPYGEDKFRLIADTSPVALVISETASGNIHSAHRQRSEERRAGKEGASTFRARGT